MRNFILQIYTVAIIALLCDVVASGGDHERTNSLRRRFSHRELKSSKSKSGRRYGDDDDDDDSKGKGKGKGKGGKYDKKGGKADKKGKAYSSIANSDSSKDDKSSSTSGRYEPTRKGQPDDDRSPEDDYEDMAENARAIIPVRRPNPEGGFVWETTEEGEPEVDPTSDESTQNGVVNVVKDDETMETNSTRIEPTNSSTFDIVEENSTEAVGVVEEEESEDSESEESESEESEAEDVESEVDSEDEGSKEFNTLFDVVAVKDDEPKEGDSVNEIIENAKDVAAEGGSGFFNFIDIQDEEPEEVESRVVEKTESPTEVAATLAPTGVVTEFLTEDHMAKFEDETRTVRIMHPGVENQCMTFDFLLDDMAVFMAECSDRNSRKDDYWEILQMKGERYRFQLRHKSTQLCIPMNPSNPRSAFDCLQYFGQYEAIADSFRGLVNCYSDHAAIFEVDSNSNYLFMSNADCQDPTYIDPVPVFMSYNKEELTGGRPIVVWGGHVLMGLTAQVKEFDFNDEWMFVDVAQE